MVPPWFSLALLAVASRKALVRAGNAGLRHRLRVEATFGVRLAGGTRDVSCRALAPNAPSLVTGMHRARVLVEAFAPA